MKKLLIQIGFVALVGSPHMACHQSYESIAPKGEEQIVVENEDVVLEPADDGVAVIDELSVASSSYKGFPAGYCTNYAAQSFDAVAPAPGVNWRGNAGDWYVNAGAVRFRKSDGRTYRWVTSTTVSQFVNGTILVWRGGGFGHVGVFRGTVQRRVGNQLVTFVQLAEMNWGAITNANTGVTVNFGKVTTAELPVSNLNRGSYTFVGGILPRQVVVL